MSYSILLAAQASKQGFPWDMVLGAVLTLLGVTLGDYLLPLVGRRREKHNAMKALWQEMMCNMQELTSLQNFGTEPMFSTTHLRRAMADPSLASDEGFYLKLLNVRESVRFIERYLEYVGSGSQTKGGREILKATLPRVLKTAVDAIMSCVIFLENKRDLKAPPLVDWVPQASSLAEGYIRIWDAIEEAIEDLPDSPELRKFRRQLDRRYNRRVEGLSDPDRRQKSKGEGKFVP